MNQMKNFAGEDALASKVKNLSRGQKISWGVMALLALAAIPGFIALARVDDNKDSTVESVTADAERSLGGAADGSLTTLLSGSSKPPAGYTPMGTLNSGSGSWVTRAPFPAPAQLGMSDGAAVTVGDKIYHIAGHVGQAEKGNVVVPSVYIYDTLLDTFTTGPPLPTPLARGAAATDGDAMIYYVGGLTTGGTHAGQGGGNCMFSLDTSVAAANTTWAAAACPSTPRSDMCAEWVDGKLYVLGGYDETFTPLDTVEVYDPATQQWADAGVALPSGRGDVHCATLGGSIYTVGGVTNFDDEDDTQSWFTSEVVKVDVVAKTAEQRAPLPGLARGDVAVAAVSATSMLVAGGERGQRNRTHVGVHDTVMYDALADTWVTKAPMPGARFRAAAASATVHDGLRTVMVFGGHHRCESMPNYADADDDGGCDEIAEVVAFFEAQTSPIYVYEANGEGGTDLQAAQSQSAIVSPLPALTGYRMRGAVNAGGGFWATKTRLPTARSDFHAHTVGDKIYLVGGLSGTGTALHHVDMYDPVLDLFEDGSRFTSTQVRQRYASGVIESSIYVAAGLAGQEPSPGPALDTLMVWSTTTKQYTEGPTMATARSDACGAAINGKLYVVGGYSNNFEATLQSVEVYDPQSGEWSEGPPLPEPRGDCIAAAQDGVVYVAGGYYDPSGSWAPDSFQKTLYALDTRVENPAWEERAPLPVPRGDGALVAMGAGRLLLVGGETSARDERTQVATHEANMYYTQHDTWVPKAPMPDARFRFAAAAHNGIAYAFGGHQTCPADPATGELDPAACANGAHHSISAYLEAQAEPMFVHVRA